jgi:hypothetical protein
LPGSNVTFSVVATGTAPLSCQWQFNGTAIGSATNTSLTITGVQPGNVGGYMVAITNVAGSVTSAPASLTLAVPTDFLWALNGVDGYSYGDSWADGVAADASGNLLVGGRFYSGTLSLGGVVLTNLGWYGVNTPNFVGKYDGSGNLLWAQVAGTNYEPVWPLRVGTDAAGNVWLAAHFGRPSVFGTNVLVSMGPADWVLAKYSAQGQILWVRQIGATNSSPTPGYFGFSVDAAGNAYVAGRDYGSANFGSVALTNSTAFLAKYDCTGKLLWAQEALGADAIAAGADGTVCLTGSPGILAKYDSLGNLLWSRSFPVGQGIALDAQGNIYTTGYGAGIYDGFALTNSGGAADFFVAKCDPQGQLLWLRQAGGVQQQRGTGIALDPFGNVYATSASAVDIAEPMLVFGPSTLTNVFTFAVKYDSSGNPLWARAITTSGPSSALAITVKDPADVYVGGDFNGSAFLAGFTLQDPTLAEWELFVAKLDGMEPAVPPTITRQPQSQSAATGTTVTFTVTVPRGIPLSYQWFSDQAGAITDATNATLILSNIQSADAGSYFVTVSNAYGSADSSEATLTVNVPPAIGMQPQNFTVLAGQNAGFTVSATGTEPLFYQWQFNGTDLLDGTTATLLVTNATADQAGSYAVTITNMAGMVTSTPATLSIYDTAAAVLEVPTCAIGDPFQLSITGVPGFNYAIEASTNLVDWMPVATNTSPFTFVDGDATNFPVRYYRSVYLP